MNINHGRFKTDPRYTEIIRLAALLREQGIAYDMIRCYDGWKVNVLNDDKCIGDAIQHFGSYGSENNKVELMGFGLKDVRGHLAAEDAVGIIVRKINGWEGTTHQ